MFGKNPRLNPLALRKQLLIAESELNRAHLLHETQTLLGESRSLINQAGTVSSFVSGAALLATGLASFRRKKSPSENGKTYWWQAVLQGAGMVGRCWREFRDRPKP